MISRRQYQEMTPYQQRDYLNSKRFPAKDMVSSYMNKDHIAELVNLYHTARTALAGEFDKDGNRADTRWHRMTWAAFWFNKEHPDISAANAYRTLSDALS